MIEHVSFWVAGTPMQKGSTTRMPNGATLPAGTVQSRLRMTNWRSDLRTAATASMAGDPPYVGAIRLMVEFAMQPPASMPRKYFGWQPHTKRPDLDKLTRMLCDALKGIVYADDSQVTNLAIAKVYAWNGKTGANINVDFISEESARRIAKLTQGVREYVSR